MSSNEPKSLQDVIDVSGNIVEILRNAQNAAYVVPVVPSEFSNWQLEMRAWRETAALFDQSHHMDNVILRGSDVMPAESRMRLLLISSGWLDHRCASRWKSKPRSRLAHPTTSCERSRKTAEH